MIRNDPRRFDGEMDIGEEHAFEKTMEGFNAELQNPTDEPKQVPPKTVN